MSADLEPKIAADGVQEVPLTKARPLLTRLIEQAREDGLDSALTVRGRRRIYLVTPDFYERAAEDRRTVEALRRYIDEMPDEKRRHKMTNDIERLRANFAAADADD
ncbi:type II toxin-antitoxin system prevent-host-death family antitoxin [Streptomyces sp. NPDC001515]